MGKEARLIDIANALNISVTTVSRALNNKDDISQKTKAAVLEVADMLDYKPNTLAISLRKKKTFNVIGVVLPNVDHYFFSTVLKGVMSKAHLNNYLVIVGESSQDAKKEKEILDEFINYGVSGILIAPTKYSQYESNFAYLKDKRIPFVFMDRTYDDHDTSFVRSDDYHGAYQAVSHLINMGYQKIAHIKSSDGWSIGTERCKGYFQALQDHDLDYNSAYLKSSDTATKEDGYLLTAEYFKMDDPPDAIFTVTDDVASGVYEYAHEHQIDIPSQLGVVGFSNSILSSILIPKLTTVEQLGEQMGETAFDYFFQIRKDKRNSFQKTFESKLIVRESSQRKI